MFHFVILSKLETTSGEKKIAMFMILIMDKMGLIYLRENTQNWKFQGMQIV